MSRNKMVQQAITLFSLVLFVTACSGPPGGATSVAQESVGTLVPPTLTSTQTLTHTSTPMPPTSTPLSPTATNTPLPPTATSTPLPPTSTPLPPTSTPMPPTSTPALAAIGSPIAVGKWEATIAFNVGEAVNIVNFSFTVSENGEQIEGFGILDLGLGQITTGATSVAIIDGTFSMNADSYSGTTRIGRTFEGTFVASDKVEGTFVFDYGSGRVYEGEWTGAPESQD